MSAFPVSDTLNPRADYKVLFRVETDNRNILVQSIIQPNWNSLPEGYCQDTQTKSFQIKPQKGAIFQFRLTANPTNKNGGKVTGTIRSTRELIKWLENRSLPNGFEIAEMTATVNPTQRARKPGGTLLTIHTAKYEGLLRVTDPDAIAQTIENGLGAAKSYGCGLLSLSRV